MMRLMLVLLALSALTFARAAVEPDEILDDPALEERARAISRELRCVTCQSESIDDSAAPLAKDLRIIVRERLVAGDSDAEVFAYVTDRYGDYVLLKPAVKAETLLLWATPLLAFAGAAAFAFFYFRNMREHQALTTTASNRDNPENP